MEQYDYKPLLQGIVACEFTSTYDLEICHARNVISGHGRVTCTNKWVVRPSSLKNSPNHRKLAERDLKEAVKLMADLMNKNINRV